MSSISGPEEPKNPTEIFLELDAKKGVFFYYDKNAQERVEIELPMVGILLDQVNCISGFCERFQSKIYSNEVRNVKKEKLYVRSYVQPGIKTEGMYADIMPNIATLGAKFTSSLYFYIKIKGRGVLVNLKLKSAACNAWIEFFNKHKNELRNKAVCFRGVLDAKKGSNEYKKLVIGTTDLTEETKSRAIEMDKNVLQPYLKYALVSKYVQNKVDNDPVDVNPSFDEPVYNDTPHSDGVDDLPF